MGNLVTNRMLVSSHDGGAPDPGTERRFLSLIAADLAAPEPGRRIEAVMDLDLCLPEPDEMRAVTASPLMTEIGLAALAPEGHRVLREMAEAADASDVARLFSAEAGELHPEAILRRAGIDPGPDLELRAERRVPGCLLAGRAAIRAWSVCKEIDPARWAEKVRGSRAIDTDVLVGREPDGALYLRFDSVNAAASGVFRAMALALPDAMISAWAVDEDSDYAYRAVTDGPGELAEAETWDEETLREAYEGVYGPGATPCRYLEDDENDPVP